MASIESGNGKCKTVLVVGGGIAGITTALEAAEAGCEVVLIEKSATLGGRVAGFNQYFPKLCPPSCGLEINYKRLNANPRVTVLTLAELEGLSGEPGSYEATIKLGPRYVTDACTLCGECSQVCPAEVADEFNFAMAKVKAIRLPHRSAYPALYAIDRAACPSGCHACVDACKYQAINLQEQPRKMTLQVASVVLATGWAPYDAARIDNLGFGKCANVVTNVMFERLAAADGPTKGKILRPSDGKEPKAIAFVQCAGSRDQNHLPYCSGVCCTASLKHATYVRSQYPEAKITMFYIDLRTPGHLQEFGAKVAAENGIELIKGKVGKVQEHPVSRDLQVVAEDVLSSRKIMREYDLVVLATGMVPQTSGIAAKVTIDEFGFAAGRAPGVYAAGCVKRPAEVAASIRDATGAALKAFQIAAGAAHHG
ncbi:MAG TPA: FAD-dependent oxidoreductase [Terriglobales bacterium]|nr:FAD-dependent oxidoreductase [Terriglobales bacterium]